MEAIAQLSIWPSMNKDVLRWARSYFVGQKKFMQFLWNLFFFYKVTLTS